MSILKKQIVMVVCIIINYEGVSNDIHIGRSNLSHLQIHCNDVKYVLILESLTS